jgi:hypothetical protein
MNTPKIDFPDCTTTDQLGDLYEAFCASQDLPHPPHDLPHMASHDLWEKLKTDAETLQAQVAWLEAFGDKCQEIEGFEGDVLILSRYICAIMREALTPQQLTKVNNINAMQGTDKGCASHNIIDANIVAYGAFCSMFFREMDAANEDDCRLVNAAWDRAMRCKYGVEQGPSA